MTTVDRASHLWVLLINRPTAQGQAVGLERTIKLQSSRHVLPYPGRNAELVVEPEQKAACLLRGAATVDNQSSSC